MGFFSGIRQAGGYIFNFRVTKWVGLDSLKDSSKQIYNTAKSVTTPAQAEHIETFEEALQRLNLTEEQLQERRKEFTRLMLIFILIAIALFIYSIYIVYVHKNFLGFFMGFSVTIFALSQAFRYHFWLYQIRHRKLGCTLKEWFNDSY